jgi:bifunctional enzyme CysN/CysC
MDAEAANPSPIVGRRWSEGPDEGPHPLRFSQHPLPSLGEGKSGLLRFITCGSVDDGKSTLIGRLLYEADAVPEDQLATLNRDSRKFGTQGDKPDFALLVDGLSAEREQGITIDVAYRYFHTDKRSFIVADTPGHEQYTRNMATGASTADLAIILIDARKGVLPQTRRHSFITSMLGVKHAVVAINKMDLVEYSRDVFEKIVADYTNMAAPLNFSHVTFIPLSALEGENVSRPSQAMPWYKGKPILTHLEDVKLESEAALPFRMPVQWVNRPDQHFRGFSGTITSGILKPGDAVLSMPSGLPAIISRIVTFDGNLEQAGAGQAVTLVLDREIDVSRGDVLLAAQDTLKPHSKAQAHLFWMSERAMLEGGRFLIKLGPSLSDTSIETLHHALDIHSFEPVTKRVLAMNEIGHVSLRFDKPLMLAPYAQDKALGGFILIDRLSNETVAIGLMDGVTEDAGRPERAHFSWTDWLDITEQPSQQSVRQVLSWRLMAAFFMGLAAFLLTQNGLAAIVFGLGELLIRPILRRIHGQLWAALQKSYTARDLRDAEDAGSGI